MSDHSFSSDLVEEFYNSFHDRNTGRFTFAKGGKRGKIHVPMSENARRSNAIMRRLSADRKTKEYKTAKARINDTWANREKGQGGLRHVKGVNSKKADEARAANAVKGGKKKVLTNLNTKAAAESAARAKAQLAMLTSKKDGNPLSKANVIAHGPKGADHRAADKTSYNSAGVKVTNHKGEFITDLRAKKRIADENKRRESFAGEHTEEFMRLPNGWHERKRRLSQKRFS